MKTESNRQSLEALKNLLSETDLILSTTRPLPENRTERCRELLGDALALADDLLKQGQVAPAVAMGHKGGEYHRQAPRLGTLPHDDRFPQDTRWRKATED